MTQNHQPYLRALGRELSRLCDALGLFSSQLLQLFSKPLSRSTQDGESVGVITFFCDRVGAVDGSGAFTDDHEAELALASEALDDTSVDGLSVIREFR